jgi:hypothetical protein
MRVWCRKEGVRSLISGIWREICHCTYERGFDFESLNGCLWLAPTNGSIIDFIQISTLAKKYYTDLLFFVHISVMINSVVQFQVLGRDCFACFVRAFMLQWAFLIFDRVSIAYWLVIHEISCHYGFFSFLPLTELSSSRVLSHQLQWRLWARTSRQPAASVLSDSGRTPCNALERKKRLLRFGLKGVDWFDCTSSLNGIRG